MRARHAQCPLKPGAPGPPPQAEPKAGKGGLAWRAACPGADDLRGAPRGRGSPDTSIRARWTAGPGAALFALAPARPLAAAAGEGVFGLKYPKPENVGFPARAPRPCVDHSALSPRARTGPCRWPPSPDKGSAPQLRTRHPEPPPCILVLASAGKGPSRHPRAGMRESRTPS